MEAKFTGVYRDDVKAVLSGLDVLETLKRDR